MKKAVIAFVVLGIVGAGGYGVYHHFLKIQKIQAESLPPVRMLCM